MPSDLSPFNLYSDFSGADLALLARLDPEAYAEIKAAIDLEQTERDREEYEGSLIAFIKRAWREVESRPLALNWHHYAIADNLENIADGTIRNLVINIPPRHSKTLITNIFFPAWIWTQSDIAPLRGPHVKFLCVSYGATLAEEIALKMRRLVMGDWYQTLWGHRVRILDDQKSRANFGNSAGGERMSNSIEGGLLGRGGDIQICFPYEEIIWTENGPEPIGLIVEERRRVQVWSFNRESQKVELRPITGWHVNPSRPLVRIVTDRGSLRCTRDHRVLTDRGFVAAGSLPPGAVLVVSRQMPPSAPRPKGIDRSHTHAETSRNHGGGFRALKHKLGLILGKRGAAGGLAYGREAKMAPYSTSSDASDCSGTHTVFFCEHARWARIGRYFAHHFFCQMASAVAKSTVPLRVLNILQSRTVFEIIKTGVSCVAVYVSDLLFDRGWSKECPSYHDMNLSPCLFSFGVNQTNVRIVIPRLGFCPEDFTSNRAMETPNATDRARFIEALEAWDGEPSFVRVVDVERVHDVPSATYCVSVEHNRNMVVGQQLYAILANCDDPQTRKGADSEAERAASIQGMSDLTTRITDPRTVAKILIMQRLHLADATDWALKNWSDDTVHLLYPARFSLDTACPTDPRTVPGELLWPDVWTEEELFKIERGLEALDGEILSDYACTPGESPVLMADLSLRPISEIQIGDSIVGFTTGNSATAARPHGRPMRRRLVETKVLAVHRYSSAAIVRIEMESGAVVRCTPDHRWYRKNGGSTDRKHIYGVAKVGGKLGRVCHSELPTLEGDDLHLAGWLAGFFDGEGSVSLCAKFGGKFGYRASSQIAFYQGHGRNAPLCDKLEVALNRFGFEWGVYEDERKESAHDGGTGTYKFRQYRLRGDGLPMFQKFVHLIKPLKWRDRMIAGAFGNKFIKEWDKIVRIEPDGWVPVYALETTTGNYIVSGYASSNSAGQLQQNPIPRGGGIINKQDWNIWPEWVPRPDDMVSSPSGLPFVPLPEVSHVIMSLDTNYSEKDTADWTACLVLGIWHRPRHLTQIVHRDGMARDDLVLDDGEQPRVILMGGWRMRGKLNSEEMDPRTRQPAGVAQRVIQTARQFPVDELIIEDATRGKDVKDEIERQMIDQNFTIRLFNPKRHGDKVARLNAVQPLFSQGLVYAPAKCRVVTDERGYEQVVVEEFAWVTDVMAECVVGDTQIITQQGLKSAKDIMPGEMVLTHRGRFRPVVWTRKSEATNLVRLRAKGLREITLTANHPVYEATVGWDHKFRKVQWTEAGKVKPRSYTERKRRGKITREPTSGKFPGLCLPTPIRENPIDEIDLREWATMPNGKRMSLLYDDATMTTSHTASQSIKWRQPLDRTFGRVMGLYLAEGSGTRSARYWSFNSETEVGLVKEVEAFISDRLGCGFYTRTQGNCTTVSVSAPLLTEFFNEFGVHAANKRIPEWVWDAPDEFVAGLVDGVAEGDGHIYKDTQHVVSVSPSLLWGLRLLAARVGIYATVNLNKPAGTETFNGREYDTLPLWTARWAVTKKSNVVFGPDDLMIYALTDSEPLEGAATVYNFEVAEDNSYVTTGGIVHNCEAVPRGAHDDYADSLSMGLLHLRESGYIALTAEYVRQQVAVRSNYAQGRGSIRQAYGV